MGLYCLFISRDWFPLYLTFVTIWFIAFLIMLTLPESPRWLLYGDRREDAIKMINYMAWFNGCPKESYIPNDAIFEEIEELRQSRDN